MKQCYFTTSYLSFEDTISIKRSTWYLWHCNKSMTEEEFEKEYFSVL